MKDGTPKAGDSGKSNPAVLSVELLSCPFCGSLEEPHAKYEHIVLDERHALQCWNCGATGPFTVNEQMIGKHWNRREPVWNLDERSRIDAKLIKAGHQPEDITCVHADYRALPEPRPRHCLQCGTCMWDAGD